MRSALRLVAALASIAIFGVPATAQPTASAAEPSVLQSAVPQGSGSFVFTDWAGPDLRVWTYVPEVVSPKDAPIVIVMHGMRRNADTYRDQWIEPAERGGFIVVAPEFSREDFPRAAGYNLGNIGSPKDGTLRDERLWSFSAIEPLFDDVVARLGGEQSSYTIYGHSAGSQFVHRLMMFKPDLRAKRVIAANAGWYTFADPQIEFPFGLGGLDIADDTLAKVLARDVVILLGSRDNDPEHASLNRSDGAMRQGPHRFARGEAFYTAARQLAAARDLPFGWSLRVVEDVAHSNRGMAQGAYDLIE